MWKLIALAVAVGALAAPAMAADQIQVKGSDTGTFSIVPAGPPGIYLATDVSSGVASSRDGARRTSESSRSPARRRSLRVPG